MPEGIPIPGKTKPTEREVRRAQLGRSEDWRYPEKKYERGKDHPGTIYCPRCHAISEQKRWFFDESRYQEIRELPTVKQVVCSGCRRIENQIYGGEVFLRSPLLVTRKDEALSLIRNTADTEMRKNPIARIASIEAGDDEIYVLTTTRWLAQRIGKEFAKALGGEVTIDNLPQEKFSRVRWERAS
jgi:NMD protein affecting ribosome stability and mRNA decay